MNGRLTTDMDVLARPYWQESGVGLDLPRRALPARVDVLIVGAGYTGLSAAHETAAAGADTWVLEAGCGQGVPLAPYFGMRVGQKMVGLAEGRTALDGLPFPSRPYYFGVPWFLAPSVFAYRALDAMGI